ncbi:uncharacterized protein LOC106638415 [Copidosoma floridanum]|uniref:uncharacterized protein LOC106638415 n=1 Tax=Copidosoma floridanum TaxID=29053 RepID=UPI0006C97E12|nr:uncharacterized protein LOC106638415 [Copidosoma floridanum]
MSFCIRGIASNGSRYVVPQIVQGCTGGASVRRFNSRQLPVPVKSQTAATTGFLNEFLGSNLQLSSSFRTKDECQVEGETSSPGANVQVDELFHSQQPAWEVVEHDTHPMSRLKESHQLLSNQEENWLHLNRKTSLTRLGDLLTKDSAKDTGVQFSVVPKIAAIPKEKNVQASSTEKNFDKKTNEDLTHVYETLKIDFPAFFIKTINYKIYHPEIEFVNNIKGETTKGIYPYVKQMAWLRTVGHIKYAYVKMDVLQITMHTQDNTVRVRWRINGITGIRVLINFWKFKFWKIRESLKEAEAWHDGFSTFYVGDDGLVFKHVADKIMPDEDVDIAKPKDGIPSKLASQLTFSSLK